MSVYKPYLMRVEEITDETHDTRTLKLRFQNQEEADAFIFKAGQFGEYSAIGAGESTFCIASSPTRKGYIECSFKVVGKVTTALKSLDVGDTMGFRGPYGNHFPVDKMKNGNVIFIAGGIGLAPVRCVIWNVLDQRSEFKNVSIIYGARSVKDLVYKRELEEWKGRSDINLFLAVDPGGETQDWRGEICFVPTLVERSLPDSDYSDTSVVLCGPPIMIKFTLPILQKLGFSLDKVYTTLENRMKCGIGKCGRCNIGSKYVCKDGPVFTAAELAELPMDY